ncbi:MAG TPA: CehA/McbA family metallohydrolase [Trueperaceae bacterium]|nr:CehA/McbA family metallohydrolase [Trueperaceae bacterium]
MKALALEGTLRAGGRRAEPAQAGGRGADAPLAAARRADAAQPDGRGADAAPTDGRGDAGEAGPYLTLPFEVPPGTTRIDVRYRYDAGHILDLGLFDPRMGPFPSTSGFRGWSGSARDHVFVATDVATPGYLAGEMPAGSWQVVLGLAKLGEASCAYRVDVELRDDPLPVSAPVPARPVRVPGPRWFRGDLHSHTYYSDAHGSLGDLTKAARARGLDFLAVTDHNTTGHHGPVRASSTPELVLLPGEEITTYRGHANVWGVDGWVDFRLRDDADVATLVEQVHARGGLFAVNHPRAAPGCIGCDWEYAVPDGADCFEAWNGPWGYRNWEALERYDAQLRRGLRPTLTGGSDRHQPGWPDADPELLWVGTPTTWFYLEELSEASLLAGLRSGRACVSEGPEGPRLELEVEGVAMGGAVPAAAGRRLRVRATVTGGAGAVLRYVAASGAVREVPVESDAFQDGWQWQAAGPFLRAEVVAVGDEAAVSAAFEALAARGKVPRWITLEEVLAHPRRRALSNPVYLTDGG